MGRGKGGKSQHRSEDGGHLGGDQGQGDSLRSHNRLGHVWSWGKEEHVRSAVSVEGDKVIVVTKTWSELSVWDLRDTKTA